MRSSTPKILLLALWSALLLGHQSARADGDAGELDPAIEAWLPYVSEIRIEGNRRTRDDVIVREIDCRVGDPATGLDCEQMLAQLRNTNLFSEVKVAADSVSTPGEVILHVKVKERIAILPYPILKQSDKSGWSAGAGINFMNFRGRRERLALAGSAGGDRGFSVDYSNPWVGPRLSLSLSTSFRLEDNNFEDFTEENFSVGVGLGKAWTSDNRWRTRVSAGYQSLISNEPDKTIATDDHDQLPAVGFGITYDTRDYYANPRVGWLCDLGVTWYGGALGGTVDYRHVSLDLRRFQPMSVGRTLGFFVRGTRRTGQVPVYRRLYVGGSGTVRGYTSTVRAGNHSLLAGSEWRFELMQPRLYSIGPLENVDFGLGFAFFADAGTAWEADEALDWQDMVASFGVSLQVLMQWLDVGRADLAITTDGDVVLDVAQGMKF